MAGTRIQAHVAFGLVSILFLSAAGDPTGPPTNSESTAGVRLGKLRSFPDLLYGRPKVITPPDGSVDLFVPTKSKKTAKPNLRRFRIKGDNILDLGDVLQLDRFKWKNLRDVVVDTEGRIHVLSANQYFVLKRTNVQSGVVPYEEWKSPDNYPGSYPRLAAGDEGLAFAFRADAKTRAAWGVAGGAAPPGLGIYPMRYAPDKIIVGFESPAGWSDWAILDPETREEPSYYQIVYDGRGVVHLLYSTGSRKKQKMRYARIDPDEESDKGRQSYREITGVPLDERQHLTYMILPDEWEGPAFDLAVDPDSGKVLALSILSQNRTVTARSIVDEEVGPPIQLIEKAWAARAAPAGDGDFHVVVRHGGYHPERIHVSYLAYRNGGWSDPVELGRGMQLDALESVGPGRAVVVWRHMKKLVAREVEFESAAGNAP